jgi:hypothetical protein
MMVFFLSNGFENFLNSFQNKNIETIIFLKFNSIKFNFYNLNLNILIFNYQLKCFFKTKIDDERF